MRKVAYLTAFTVVGISSLIVTTVRLLSIADIRVAIGNWFTIPQMFGHPVPQILMIPFPYSVNTVLAIGLAMLVLRRLWRMASRRSLVPPPSYLKWLHVVILVGVLFLVASLIVLVATFLLGPASGVPGAMLMLPAVYVLPPAVAIVELWSLVRERGSPNNAVHRAREDAARR